MPTPITNTFPPKAIDYGRIIISAHHSVQCYVAPPARTYEDTRPDRTLHPSTLERKLQLGSTRGLLDLSSDFLGRLTTLDEDGLDVLVQGLGEIETGLEEVGDDDWGGTEGFGGEEGDETDRTRAAETLSRESNSASCSPVKRLR